jgi:hypothetical protein
MSIPTYPNWLILKVQEALAKAGRWAAQKICEKFMGDKTCGGWL